jgi:proline iminopeptidase
MTAKLQAAPPPPPTPASDEEDLDAALISCHYYKNNAFMQDPEQLVTHLDRLRDIPTQIIQGRYDMNTPAHRAFLLKEKLPQAILTIVPDAGHSAWEPGTLHHLIEATESFKSILTSPQLS